MKKVLQNMLRRTFGMRRLPAEKHLIYNASRWPWSSFHRSLEHLHDREFFAAARA